MVKIAICNRIITEYLAQNLRLTLRQLYYQLVTRNVITNEEKSYKNLSNLISDARLAGLVDWDAIEDRIRQPRKQNQFEDLNQLADAALASYRLPRWRGQNYYLEVWCEKDALAGVIAPLARQHHVTVLVNRGYSSQSAMYESAKRLIDQSDIKQCIILYLGDHDPSGEDMVRDIRDRFYTFGADVEIIKIALTYDQIQQYNPPPNPAKLSDPRAQAYIAKFGDTSWEVDALPPNVLAQLITNNIKQYINQDTLNEVLEQENKDKETFQKALELALKETNENNN